MKLSSVFPILFVIQEKTKQNRIRYEIRVPE